ASFGAARSAITRPTSARCSATGACRRTASGTSGSASPGLTTEQFYTFTAPAFRYSHVYVFICIDPPGGAGSDTKWKPRLPFWQARIAGLGVRKEVENTVSSPNEGGLASKI